MLCEYKVMNMGNEIAGYLLNISWEEMKVAKREKVPPVAIKKTPPLHFKKGGWVGRNKGLKTIGGPSHPTNLKKFCPLMRVY